MDVVFIGASRGENRCLCEISGYVDIPTIGKVGCIIYIRYEGYEGYDCVVHLPSLENMKELLAYKTDISRAAWLESQIIFEKVFGHDECEYTVHWMDNTSFYRLMDPMVFINSEVFHW